MKQLNKYVLPETVIPNTLKEIDAKLDGLAEDNNADVCRFF